MLADAVISPERRPLLLGGNWGDADAEAEFVTDPDASSELRPKNKQEMVGVVSFNH